LSATVVSRGVVEAKPPSTVAPEGTGGAGPTLTSRGAAAAADDTASNVAAARTARTLHDQRFIEATPESDRARA
jgi:hypothetical protein